MDTTFQPDTAQRLRSAAVGFGSEPLLVSPDSGDILPVSTAYIPLLVNFTFEDKAAKGLRKRTSDDKLEPPVYFSALELVRDSKVLLLSGEAGSGKTTFAKQLCYRLATTGFEETRPIPRNDVGAAYMEKWDAEGVIPWYFGIHSQADLQRTIESAIPGLVDSFSAAGAGAQAGVLIVLDIAASAGEKVAELLVSLVGQAGAWSNVKLLMLGDTGVCEGWALPSDVARHNLLPLLEAQRRQTVERLMGEEGSRLGVGTGAAAATPALFALALEASDMGNQAEELVDAWLCKVTPNEGEANKLAAHAFESLKGFTPEHAAQSMSPSDMPTSSSLPLLRSRVVQQLLAARHLSRLPVETAVDFFHAAPKTAEPVIRSLLVRLGNCPDSSLLVAGLVQEPGPHAQRGALLASDFSSIVGSAGLQGRVTGHIGRIVEEGTLSPMERRKAGRVLSRLGDGRDLEALAEVGAGAFTMGSGSHANSEPVATASSGKFRIGKYPVVNRDYSRFVQETGRTWQSADGGSPDKRNAPATDLTWHDAMAYCSWVTARWRQQGRISGDEHARLPTELEWERAARGDVQAACYPWGPVWRDDAANCEETGFNEPCAVGLFPRGRSPWGCFDMAGQVWEWCSTLWGEDMATPAFRYPYRDDDGREALDAPEATRRVLRGGCFSSSRLKASSTYRGSLEPAGFWRGNGFRVVVEKQADAACGTHKPPEQG